MLRIFSPQLYSTVLLAGAAAAFLYVQVNLIAAAMFAGESKAPLVFTLLVTTAASALVSILLAASPDDKGSVDSQRSQSVATFVFINASASAVGLLANLLESLEFTEPAGPNGLTWMFEVILREDQAPLVPYMIVLAVLLVFVSLMLMEGAQLLFNREQWTEEKLGVISTISFFLFVAWVGIGTKWKTVPFGAEAIANIWTIIFYSTVTLIALWVYGLMLFRGLKAAPKAISVFGKGIFDVLSNWKLWAVLAVSTVVAAVGFFLATYFVNWMNELVSLLLAWLGVLSASASQEIGKVGDATSRLARTELLPVGIALVATYLLILVGALAQRLVFVEFPKIQFGWKPSWTKFKKGLASILRSSFLLISVPILGLLRFLIAVVRKPLVWQLMPGCVILLMIFSGEVTPPQKGPIDTPVIITAEPASEPPAPVSIFAEASRDDIIARISDLEFCSSRFGALGWAFGSEDTLVQDISGCFDKLDFGEGVSITFLVAASSSGSSKSQEEQRSFRRAQKLAEWASRSFQDLSTVRILDLGMSNSFDLSARLSPLVGPTMTKRPVGGFVVHSKDERVQSSQLLELAIRTVRQAQIGSDFSKCDLYKINLATEQLLELDNSEICSD